MINTKAVASLLTLIALGACTIMPTGPGVVALPGSQKTLEDFQADDTACRQHANIQATMAAGTKRSEPDELQRRYDYAYIQCMYSKGHKVPVPSGYTNAPAGSPPAYVPPPPPPAS